LKENRTLLLGIGNPILSDDGIGVVVSRAIQDMGLPGIDVAEASASGIEVMEMMMDYEKVVIVDAIMLPDKAPGEILRLHEGDFTKSVHGSSPHGINLATAIALGRKVSPERMPSKIVFFAMQAEDVSTFCEEQTPKVAERIVDLIDLVKNELTS